MLMRDRRRMMMGMSYKTYLYKAGDECTNLTGGWLSATYNGTVAKNADHLYAKAYRASWYNANPVDMTKYKKLVCHFIEVKGRTDSSNYDSLFIMVNDTLTVSYGWPMDSSNVDAKFEDNGSYYNKTLSDLTLELDISNLSGNKYIGVMVDCAKSNAYYKLDEVWLEA